MSHFCMFTCKSNTLQNLMKIGMFHLSAQLHRLIFHASCNLLQPKISTMFLLSTLLDRPIFHAICCETPWR